MIIQLHDLWKAISRKSGAANPNQLSLFDMMNFDEADESEKKTLHEETRSIAATTRTNPKTGEIIPVAPHSLTVHVAPEEVKKEKEKEKHSQTAEELRAEKYKNEKPADIQNVGEDVIGARRHIFDTYDDVEQMERAGVAQKFITKDKLVGDYQLDLDDAETETDRQKIVGVFVTKKLLRASPPNAPLYRKIYSDFCDQLKVAEATTGTGPEFRTMMRDFIANMGDRLVSTDMYVQHYQEHGQERIETAIITALGPCVNIFDPVGLGYYIRKTKKNELADYTGSYINVKIGSPEEERKKERDGKYYYKPENFRERIEYLLGKQPKKKDIKKEPRIYISDTVERTGKGLTPVPNNPTDAQRLLKEKMKIRGIQYGNSQTEEDRKYHTLRFAEAAVDLAKLLDIPEEDITFNGRLAIAFGARGRGGKGCPLAHYEPSQRIINITNSCGYGTVAHEWAHFIDDVLGELTVGKKELCSSGLSGETVPGLYKDESEIPPGTVAISSGKKFTFNPQHNKSYPWIESKTGGSYRFKYLSHVDFQKPLPETPFTKAATIIHDITESTRSGLGETLGKYSEYWHRPQELFARAFEAHIWDKFEEHGFKNTYLADAGERALQSDVYPSDPELRKSLNTKFNELFKVMRENKLLKKAFLRLYIQ